MCTERLAAIRALCEKVAGRPHLNNCIELGGLLNEEKQEQKRDQKSDWKGWLRKNAPGISQRMAEHYMNCWTYRNKIETVSTLREAIETIRKLRKDVSGEQNKVGRSIEKTFQFKLPPADHEELWNWCESETVKQNKSTGAVILELVRIFKYYSEEIEELVNGKSHQGNSTDETNAVRPLAKQEGRTPRLTTIRRKPLVGSRAG